MQVKDAVCLVTGSAQGLGKAFAVRLLAAGARVCISDVREEGGKATLAELRGQFGEDRVVFVMCDVTQPDQFRRLFDECEAFFKVPCVDLLVNNAGIGVNFGWKKCMEVNIIGVMTGTELAMERMVKQPRKGTIVNTASMAGIGTGFSADAQGYFVSKHGVVQLTRTLNASFSESGVEVKAICPAWADTEIVSGVEGDDKKAVINKLVTAHGGLMTVERVADAFFSLLTECPRGSVLACLNTAPFFVIPDLSETMIKVLAITAIMINKVMGTTTVQAADFKKAFIVILCLLLLCAYLF